MERGGEIFPPSRFPRARFFMKGLKGPIFNRSGLDSILQDKFGEIGFWEAKTRLCIPAVEGKHGEVHIYKTPHHFDYRRDWKKSTFEVAQATSAAPVYLEAINGSGYTLVDGGLFANDPITVALVDALTCFELPRENVRILSLGCLEETWNLRQVQKFGKGWLGWGPHTYEVTGSLQSQNAQGQAGLLVGPENIQRINAPQPSKRISLDDWQRARTELPPIATDLLRIRSTQIVETFFNKPITPYVPCYTPNCE